MPMSANAACRRPSEVSYETVRRWDGKFGGASSRPLQGCEALTSLAPRRDGRADRRRALLRTVDEEGEVRDLLVQCRRDRKAAIRSTSS